MARTFPTIQPGEIQAYARFCEANSIINDDSVDAKENADLVVKYFTETWGADLNDQNLALAFPQLKSLLKFESAARAEARRVAKDFPDVQGLGAWFDTQNILANQGDDGFRNITELMLELQGRPVTQANITAAISSIQNSTQGGGTVGKFSTRHRKPLIYVQRQQERKKSFHEATDDGTNPFSTSGMVKMADGSYRSKTYAEQKRDRDAAEAAKSTPAKEKGPANAWETVCNELLRFGTHSAQANMRELYDRGVQQGKSFRQIYADMNALKASYERLLSTAKY
jgi:hypothetical protein